MRPPPYVPFKTFLTAIEAFERSLPNQIDRSVWPSHSGATQGQLLGAFRFLGLTDDKDRPSAELRALIERPENRPATLRRILESSFRELAPLDLSKASPRQLDEAVRRYGLSGATHRKAVSFLLHAAAYAGTPLSPLLHRKTRAPGLRRPAPAPRTASRGESKTIRLRSGGSLTLVMDGRFLDLAKEDREFVFGLLDQMAAYEQSR
jgi:hypothetical protein